jgi:hypothetical protein
LTGTPSLAPNATMGFNKRRMESERAAAAAKEPDARRALGRQVLEDAERLNRNLERTARSPHADAVLADYRSRDCRSTLVSVGALSGLLNHQCR